MGFSSVAAKSTTPNSRFVFPRKADRPEHGAALVANLAREYTIPGEEFVRLLRCEYHARTAYFA